jgi:VIT1/CCC1 family predicted Fe2+/Mn2+ transporter
MTDLESRIAAIEERNLRVEADKSWEVSLARRLTISVITYITALVLLWFIGAANPALGALVPVAGFLLSTLSLSTVRRLWTVKK